MWFQTVQSQNSKFMKKVASYKKVVQFVYYQKTS